MDRGALNAELVRTRGADQLPHWADLSACPGEPNGWDNVTFALAEEFCVRPPSHGMYVAEIDKEQWSRFGWTLVIAGYTKAGYDLLLLVQPLDPSVPHRR